MSVYRFLRHAGPIEIMVEMVAEQDGVDPSDVRVKRDPHPGADADEIVLCTTDELDHWPAG